jgi:hypothetical protein
VTGLRAIAVCWVFAAIPASAQNPDVTIVADQIRGQGYPCTNPSAATRVEAESKPNQPVYILVCENATYKVQITADMPATVTEMK